MTKRSIESISGTGHGSLESDAPDPAGQQEGAEDVGDSSNSYDSECDYDAYKDDEDDDDDGAEGTDAERNGTHCSDSYDSEYDHDGYEDDEDDDDDGAEGTGNGQDGTIVTSRQAAPISTISGQSPSEANNARDAAEEAGARDARDAVASGGTEDGNDGTGNTVVLNRKDGDIGGDDDDRDGDNHQDLRAIDGQQDMNAAIAGGNEADSDPEESRYLTKILIDEADFAVMVDLFPTHFGEAGQPRKIPARGHHARKTVIAKHKYSAPFTIDDSDGGDYRVVKIQRSGMDILPPTIGTLDALKSLCIENYRGDSLPPQIGDLSQLEELTISNQYTKFLLLPPEIGRLTELRSLKLWCHDLQALPQEIGKLAKLRSLDLRFCYRLKSLPETIGELKRLAKLQVRLDSVSEFPEWIWKLPHLEELELGDSCESSDIKWKKSSAIGKADVPNLARLAKVTTFLSVLLRLPPAFYSSCRKLSEMTIFYDERDPRKVPRKPFAGLTCLENLTVECHDSMGYLTLALGNLFEFAPHLLGSCRSLKRLQITDGINVVFSFRSPCLPDWLVWRSCR
jgi:hypothetical protein